MIELCNKCPYKKNRIIALREQAKEIKKRIIRNDGLSYRTSRIIIDIIDDILKRDDEE